jgi:hypothetical protein
MKCVDRVREFRFVRSFIEQVACHDRIGWRGEPGRGELSHRSGIYCSSTASDPRSHPVGNASIRSRGLTQIAYWPVSASQVQIPGCVHRPYFGRRTRFGQKGQRHSRRRSGHKWEDDFRDWSESANFRVGISGGSPPGGVPFESKESVRAEVASGGRPAGIAKGQEADRSAGVSSPCGG